jgi:hypothetical protein
MAVFGESSFTCVTKLSWSLLRSFVPVCRIKLVNGLTKSSISDVVAVYRERLQDKIMLGMSLIFVPTIFLTI